MKLESDYKTDAGKTEGSRSLYTVEARYNSTRPIEIAGQLFDNRWQRVKFSEAEPGCEGVPANPDWSYMLKVLVDDDYTQYPSAQALRWWLHAEAENCCGGFGLETRIIKHELKYSQTITAVSQHCVIGFGNTFEPKEDRSETGLTSLTDGSGK